MTGFWRRPAFTVFSLAVLGTGSPIIRDLYQLAAHNETASHHILVPFIVLALIYQGRDSIFAVIRTDLPSGVAVILGGIGLVLGATPGGEASLTMAVAGLVLVWAGGFLLCWGRDAFRQAAFPLLFLGFAIPMPAMLIEGTTHLLKVGSAELVAGLLTVTQTPYDRAGFVFALPQFSIEIADECSGIRSSIALLLTGALSGHLLLQTGWKKVLLMVIILPLAVVKNGIRIVSLCLLATRVDPAFLTGALHHEGGIAFFLLTLTMLAPILVVLYNSEKAMTGESFGTRR